MQNAKGINVMETVNDSLNGVPTYCHGYEKVKRPAAVSKIKSAGKRQKYVSAFKKRAHITGIDANLGNLSYYRILELRNRYTKAPRNKHSKSAWYTTSPDSQLFF